jgi:hypothetical protein
VNDFARKIDPAISNTVILPPNPGQYMNKS